MKDQPNRFFHIGWAWIALTITLAIHVTDEALTNFLSVYNPSVIAIRESLPFLPLPTFTFDTWLTALILGVIFLLAISPFAFWQPKWMTIPAYVFGILMLFNGLGHIGTSIYFGRLMPGVYSSPLLLLTSSYLLLSSRHQRVQ